MVPASIGARRRKRLNRQKEIRPAGSAASVVVPAGTVVLVTSVNRLKTSFSDFAAHVEAPAPEHNHEAQTSERTLTPARSYTGVDRPPRLKGRLTVCQQEDTRRHLVEQQFGFSAVGNLAACKRKSAGATGTRRSGREVWLCVPPGGCRSPDLAPPFSRQHSGAPSSLNCRAGC